MAISYALVYVSGVLLGGVGWMASLASWSIVSIVSPDGMQAEAALNVIESIVVAWQITLAFGLLGGVYLLLRSDAGGQEAEDLWMPPPRPVEPLPELPKEAFES